MDLLASLNVDSLPEQQTKTRHLLKDHPEFMLKLGFDSCCRCGKKDPKYECQSCHRVKYCSEECYTMDSSYSYMADFGNDQEVVDEDEQALGHTSVICCLLNLCNDDEDIERDVSAGISSHDGERNATAATDRLVSEYESYPATLANVIMEELCYQETLQSCAGGSLTIHVVGASEDSELWIGHPDRTQERKVFEGYADALAEIAENYKLDLIRLLFFGPDCPLIDVDVSVAIPPVQAKKSKAKLLVKTQRRFYSWGDDNKVTHEANVVVFFNPGFTCPDYDWGPSISHLQTSAVPFLVATNTEMEAMADIQYLMDQNIFLDVPMGLREMFQSDADHGYEDNRDDETIHSRSVVDDETIHSPSFFKLNPYAGLRVRQSGTMANDLYVKNRWIFGGISSTKTAASSNKQEMPPNAKRRRVEESKNCKLLNPALV